MKALIIYMSRHGSTEKIALQLQKHLPVPADLLRLDPFAPKPDLQPYDMVIVGGSIYQGQIQSEIKKFCKDYQQELLQKHLGLFICCMNEKNTEETFRNAYPEVLWQHARATGALGGELLFEKMSLFEKIMIRTVTGHKETVSRINYAAIEQFAAAMGAVKVAELEER